MGRKVNVYLKEDLYRLLKAAADLRGVSLSKFMVDAAIGSLCAPSRASRRDAAAKMDVVRKSLGHSYTPEEMRDIREEGRRVWPKE